MLLTVFTLVGAAFKVDLHNNVYDDVASGVACPPQWLPVVLAAGISPQLPAPDESRWSDATPVAEEPNRGRLLRVPRTSARSKQALAVLEMDGTAQRSAAQSV